MLLLSLVDKAAGLVGLILLVFLGSMLPLWYHITNMVSPSLARFQGRVMYFVIEFCEGGDLFDRPDKSVRLCCVSSFFIAPQLGRHFVLPQSC